MEILRIILICLAMVQLVGSITMIGSGIKGDGFALSPCAIRDFHDVTWFGTIVLFIIDLIFFPYVYLVALLYLAFKGHWPEWFE